MANEARANFQCPVEPGRFDVQIGDMTGTVSDMSNLNARKECVLKRFAKSGYIAAQGDMKCERCNRDVSYTLSAFKSR